jgi:hypothetical protein
MAGAPGRAFPVSAAAPASVQSPDVKAQLSDEVLAARLFACPVCTGGFGMAHVGSCRAVI